MRKPKATAVVAVALMMGACASNTMTQSEFRSFLDGFEGASQQDVTNVFGEPDAIEAEESGAIVMEYERSETHRNNSGPANVGGGFSVGVSISTNVYCRLSFRLVDGEVASAGWHTSRDAIFGAKKRVDTKRYMPCDSLLVLDETGKIVDDEGDEDLYDRETLFGTEEAEG